MLGSYSNSLSEIRNSKWGESVVKMNTPGILSDQQFRGFWIKWKNGEIWVHSEGSEMPLLHWIDDHPFPIRHFSFASYDGVILQVAFNCKISSNHYIIHPSRVFRKTQFFKFYLCMYHEHDASKIAMLTDHTGCARSYIYSEVGMVPSLATPTLQPVVKMVINFSLADPLWIVKLFAQITCQRNSIM